ncbi:MAG: hypothetical protein B6241_03610 [Spirochaetaceae bacterium 4572_59]|nr:MAG: hypothetical protein B6241_03610 [Spirochaetaceae bacterium 4572_59]
MKIKKEYLIGLILLAASALYLVLQNDSKINYKTPQLAEINKDEVTSIEIQGKEKTIELNRNNKMWTIGKEEYRADSGKVSQLITEVAEMSIVDLISLRDDYARYELDDAHAVSVKVHATDTKRDFLLGKSSSSIYSYIRIPDIPGIFSVKGDLKSRFSLDSDFWRDKHVLKFNPETVSSLVLEKEGVIKAFRRDSDKSDTEWTMNDEPLPEDQDIKSRIKQLSTMSCSGFQDKAEGNPLITVKIQTEEGLNTLQIFEKQEKGYLATSSYAQTPFLLPENTGDSLLKLM